jgi:hypothetical protein
MPAEGWQLMARFFHGLERADLPTTHYYLALRKKGDVAKANAAHQKALNLSPTRPGSARLGLCAGGKVIVWLDSFVRR